MASTYEDRPSGERPMDSRPVSELISDALQQFSRLVRNEMALARAEVSDNVKQAIRGGAMLGVAAAVVIPSVVILMLALAALFVEFGMAASLAYLLTAVIGFIIAGVLGMIGMNRLKAKALMPNRTINQLHRDATAMKDHM